MERVDDRTDNAHKTCCGDLLKNMPQNNKYYQNQFYIVKTIIAGFNCSVHFYSPFCFSCESTAASEKTRLSITESLVKVEKYKIISWRTAVRDGLL